MAHKRYCSSRCQQQYSRLVADRERREAMHLWRYMRRNVPKTLDKLVAAMREEREKNVRTRGKREGTRVAT